jgi:hypothetical protein
VVSKSCERASLDAFGAASIDVREEIIPAPNATQEMGPVLLTSCRARIGARRKLCSPAFEYYSVQLRLRL